ncbi:MAG: CvpA family protein [Spirochaetales bacterium]|nr:CvpA family protein [Spirochaetales bacterium]
MSILDIIIIIITIIITVRCILKGFVDEFLSMAALIGGIAGAIFLSGPIGKLLEQNTGLGMWSQIVAFLGCFVVIYIIIKILEGVIHNIFEKFNLDKLDKALGFLLGLVEAFLVIAVFIFLLSWLTWLPFINVEQLLSDSFIAQLIKPLLIKVTQG